jgi:hypothetical protein
MHWLQLTQANTGVRIHVNMDRVIVIAPSRTGGSNLMLTVTETAPRGSKIAARILPIRESPDEIMAMVARLPG